MSKVDQNWVPCTKDVVMLPVTPTVRSRRRRRRKKKSRKKFEKIL